LFWQADWKNAGIEYDMVLKDSSLDALHFNRLGFVNYNLGDLPAATKYYQRALKANPTAQLKASLYSRLARINALQNKNDIALLNLDSAVINGYSMYGEMDTLADFKGIRASKKFQLLKDTVYARIFPCMFDRHAREFDFWVGEWDVYPRGTKIKNGHSVIQVISGGCAILENYTTPVGYSGKSINFIDNATHKWKQSWVGSSPDKQEFTDGEYKDGAMRFVFERTDAQGHKITGRFIFYNEGPDQVRQFNETSADGGKTWNTNYDFTYIRVGK